MTADEVTDKIKLAIVDIAGAAFYRELYMKDALKGIDDTAHEFFPNEYDIEDVEDID